MWRIGSKPPGVLYARSHAWLAELKAVLPLKPAFDAGLDEARAGVLV